ncbi:MAG: hypothetical protein ABJO34_13435, partial [Sedimentitalea sp.]
AISVFDSYGDILNKCQDAWNFFANDPDRITSITSRNWITVSWSRRWYDERFARYFGPWRWN